MTDHGARLIGRWSLGGGVFVEVWSNKDLTESNVERFKKYASLYPAPAAGALVDLSLLGDK